jgi:hypothetical protein
MMLSFCKRLVILSAATAVAVAIPLAGAGCGAQPGKTVMTQGGGGEPVMGTAPETGTYSLYTSMSPNPTTTIKLSEGDRLGFQRGADGKLEAVAGNQVTPLGKTTAQAYWKLKK